MYRSSQIYKLLDILLNSNLIVFIGPINGYHQSGTHEKYLLQIMSSQNRFWKSENDSNADDTVMLLPTESSEILSTKNNSG